MVALRNFWMIVAVLANAAVLAFYHEVPELLAGIFADPLTRVVTGAVAMVFFWSLFVHGLKAAVVIGRNADGMLGTGGLLDTEAFVLFQEARILRSAGKRCGQTDFGLLYEITAKKFEAKCTADVERIEVVRNFLFFVGLFFTVVAIVKGFASQTMPTNFEESRAFSFAIIQSLGLAYAITGTCLGSAVVLYVVGNVLQSHARLVVELFEEVLYRVVVLADDNFVVSASPIMQPGNTQEVHHAPVHSTR